MRIINKPNGAGKTTELVGMMFEPGNEDLVYVAPTQAQAHAIGLRTAVETYGQKETPELRERFIHAGQLSNRKGRRERYVIDEIDGVIGNEVPGEVVAIAGTDEKYREMYRQDPWEFHKMAALKKLVHEAAGRQDLRRHSLPFKGNFRNDKLAELVEILSTTDALNVLDKVLQEAL